MIISTASHIHAFLVGNCMICMICMVDYLHDLEMKCSDLPVMMVLDMFVAAAPFARETHDAGWGMGRVVSAARGWVHDAWAAGFVGFHDTHLGCYCYN